MKRILLIALTWIFAFNAFGYSKQESEAIYEKAKPYIEQEKRLDPHPSGKLTENVASFFDERYHYTIYVPKAYSAEKSWPLLLCFCPSGNAGEYVKKLITVADEFGWIIAGAIESKNGPWEPIIENGISMRYDISARFNICNPMVTYLGFSGGARASAMFCFQIFKMNSGGTIQCGAGSGDNLKPADNKNAQVYLICGTKDSNLENTRSWENECKNQIASVKLVTFDGDHTLPPVENLRDAVLWHTEQYIYFNPNADESLLKLRYKIVEPLLEEAKVLETADKKVEAWIKYNEFIKMTERFPKISDEAKNAIKAANSSIRTLEKDKDVKTEKSASAALEKEIEAAEKVADDKYKNKYIPKKLRAVYAKYPESPSGLKARALSLEWEKKLGTGAAE